MADSVEKFGNGSSWIPNCIVRELLVVRDVRISSLSLYFVASAHRSAVQQWS